MKDLNSILANNLKRIRANKNITLNQVAHMTGVSKSMLVQIEKGEFHLTISTVSKIANGLKVSYNSLLNDPETDIVLVVKKNPEPLVQDNGKYKLYPYLTYKDGIPLEVYTVEIEKGGYLSAEPHPKGTQEFISVDKGEVTIRVGDEEFTVKEGQSRKYSADKPHTYHNSGEELTKARMIMYY